MARSRFPQVRPTPGPDGRDLTARRWGVFKDSVDVVAKIAASAAIVLAAVVAHSFQSASTASTLLQQREESDTKIRAEMFRAITDRLFGEKDNPLPAEQKAVFSQLLALNFHEHIDVKPLMLEIDSTLAADIKSAGSDRRKRELKSRRDDLWSVARRVRARQVAMLVADVARHEQPAADGIRQVAFSVMSGLVPWVRPAHADPISGQYRQTGRVDLISATTPDALNSGNALPASGCEVRDGEGHNGVVGELMLVQIPGSESAIALAIETTDWESERFGVRVKVEPNIDSEPILPSGAVRPLATQATADGSAGSAAVAGQSAVLFETTWFDLPLTDNTLLASGDRFAIFIDEVCQRKDSQQKAVRLGVLWFPRDYFPARERPTNYRELRDKLDLREDA